MFEGFGFGNFTFKRAEEIFRDAFGDDELRHAGFFNFDMSSPFDNDPFFSKNKNKKMLRNENDPFGDDNEFGFGMMEKMNKRMDDQMKGFFDG